MIHPSDALFGADRTLPAIAACDHYAGTEKLIGKSFEIQDRLGPIFDVTLDLEDGAPAGHEAEHAKTLAKLLSSRHGARGAAGVRVHDPEHPAFGGDVERILADAGDVVAHVTIPKARGAQELARAIDAVRETASRLGLSREIPLHALIETHGALRDVNAIARLPWIRGLDFGLMDFVSSHHGAIPASAMRSPGQFDHALVRRAKTEIAAAALGHGLVPSHNVTIDFKDPVQAEADARRARRELGYLRMWSIHPAQIEPIVRAMAPGFDEVARASAILLAAQRASWAPIAFEDRLQDRASYRYYWELLARARACGVTVPDEARTAFFAATGPP